jgi:hypothetical protein
MQWNPFARTRRRLWTTGLDLTSVPARAYGSYLPENSDGITRLHSTAPTVTAEEVAEFKKRPRTDPIDFKKLGVIE